jgi:hypothetical protein
LRTRAGLICAILAQNGPYCPDSLSKSPLLDDEGVNLLGEASLDRAARTKALLLQPGYLGRDLVELTLLVLVGVLDGGTEPGLHYVS